jgi:hypothetical protein
LLGLGFKNGALNRINVTATKYVGSCPGFEQDKIIGWFWDKGIPVVKGRRVRITNLSLEGFSAQVPYSDREYEENNKSEKIVFDFGDNHDTNKFIVHQGVNNFSYIIYDGDYESQDMHIIKEGQFTAEFERNILTEHRDIQWDSSPSLGCLDSGTFKVVTDRDELQECRRPAYETVGRCDGRMVSRKIQPIYGDAVFERPSRNIWDLIFDSLFH